MPEQKATSGSPRNPRGRPPDSTKEVTRVAIIDAARRTFADVGFHGASLAAIAEATNLGPSALYYYYDNKEALYVAVMEETVAMVWQGLFERVAACTTVSEQVDAFLAGANDFGTDERRLSAFLVAVPVEARRHPPFAPLVELRTSWEDQVFDEIAKTGVGSGAFASLNDVETASQAVRMVLMGWSFETHYQPQFREIRADVARKVIASL